MKASGGDGLYIHVSWDQKGQQNSKSIHQYGSATQNQRSKHYHDQMNLYVDEEYKNTFFNQEDLKENSSRMYYVL